MRFLPFLLSSALLAATTATPRLARACGGTFCDRGPANVPNPPPPMPVDQTGENILFVMNGTQVEAHVQIQYTGDPERFAWIVPMPQEPTAIEPGSQPLFTNMTNATVPRLRQGNAVRDVCSSRGFSGGTFGCASDASGESTSAAGPDFDGSPNGSGGGVDPGLQVKQKVVGAYETATLKGGTVDELLVWLDENNYLIPPATAELLSSYLEQRYVFVALKLTAGAGLDEIHPISFTYPGDRPCIPLKLTAVAAKEDMAVRAFFLATDRFVPQNYKHVILNDARFNWIAPFLNQGQGGTAGFGGGSSTAGRASGPPIDLSNYKQVVSRAVDSPVANGHAFITEFAGPSSRVDRTGITDSKWTSSGLAKLAPENIPQKLMSQGVLTCSSSQCSSPYPLVLLLLRTMLPVPSSTSEAAYYNSPTSIAQQLKGKTVDVESFAVAYESMVLRPSRHAVEVLSKQSMLTRLFTTISPSEMTEDPEFRRLPGGPSVDNTALTATPRTACDGRQTRELPSGREVLVTDTPGSTPSWPTFGDEMPWAERIEEYGTSGGPVVLVNNSAAIDAALTKHHKARSWPPPTEFSFASESCSVDSGGRNAVVRATFGLALLAVLLRRRRRP